MNKTEMAERLAKTCDISQSKAKEIVDCIFDTSPGKGIIAIELDAGRKVQLAGFGSFDIGSSKKLVGQFSGRESRFQIARCNKFKLNLSGAEEFEEADLRDGRIHRVPCYRRGASVLPVTGVWRVLLEILRAESDLKTIHDRIAAIADANTVGGARQIVVFRHIQALEAMLVDGWVIGGVNKKRPMMHFADSGGRLIRSAAEAGEALRNAKGTIRFADAVT